MTRVRWKKASFSAEQTDCIELAHTFDAVRNSKNPDGLVLSINLSGLLAAIKGGDLDR
jgi:hypothetical protein